jgi:LmbE family N-acetylglucosaminyl deacetylase
VLHFLESTPKRVLVVAPHPDDELLGCGGTLLRHAKSGDNVAWAIVTQMTEAFGATPERVARRSDEIRRVGEGLCATKTYELGFPTTELDTVPRADLIGELASCFAEFKPQVVYVPFREDAHSDHGIVFDSVAAVSKSFRRPEVELILAYETLSETDFGLSPMGGFRPNVFVNIEDELARKQELLSIYESEMGEFPFPRSVEAVASLARVRGATAGCMAAEAFMVVRAISR